MTASSNKYKYSSTAVILTVLVSIQKASKRQTNLREHASTLQTKGVENSNELTTHLVALVWDIREIQNSLHWCSMHPF